MQNMLNSPKPTIHDAVKLHQSGNLTEAEKIYQSLISANPKDFNATHLMGVVFMQRGDAAAAERQIKAALKLNPNDPSALGNLGNALCALGQYDEALVNFDKAITLKKDFIDAYFNKANTLRSLQRSVEALACYDKVLQLKPAHADAHANRGHLLLDMNLLPEALASFEKALAIHPNFGAEFGRADILSSLGHHDEAFRAYDKIISQKPDFADAYHNFAFVLLKVNRNEEALGKIEKALALQPRRTEFLNMRGRILSALNRPEPALASYQEAAMVEPGNFEAQFGISHTLFTLCDFKAALAATDKALHLMPQNADALYNRGNILLELKDYEAAMDSFDKAIALNPAYAAYYLSKSNALIALKRPQEALACLEQAAKLEPTNASIYLNKSNALISLRRPQEALSCLERAATLQPTNASTLVNQGLALLELQRHEEALASFTRAIKLDPRNADAYVNIGNIFQNGGRPDEAAENFKKALALRPDYDFLQGGVLHSKMMLCDWRDYDKATAALAKDVREGQRATGPWPFLALPSTIEEQLICAKTYVKNQFPSKAQLWKGERYTHKKIRVAYVSADFHEHATAYLMAEVFELHDKEKFETFAISFSPDDKSPIQDRLKKSFSKFIDVSHLGNDAVARLIRDNEIDIAVDLKGFTTNARAGIFAERPAPLQVNYLGYPGTMGAPYIDYILADKMVIPLEAQNAYSEKVAYLPDCYQPNDRKRKISTITPSRQSLGLPEHGFVFCSFNNHYKITPDIFDVWMRILKAVPDSILWLLEPSNFARANLLSEAKNRGVEPWRLVFAARTKLEDHLARHRHADLFLDTLPYNAHTTASDALWAGLPLLTCMGQTFASRVAGSLLMAAGLPELITHSLADYQKLALALANDRQKLAGIKAKLAQNRDDCPLFNAERYTRHLEAAYTAMWQRWQEGKPVDSFDVKD